MGLVGWGFGGLIRIRGSFKGVILGLYRDNGKENGSYRV